MYFEEENIAEGLALICIKWMEQIAVALCLCVSKNSLRAEGMQGN